MGYLNYYKIAFNVSTCFNFNNQITATEENSDQFFSTSYKKVFEWLKSLLIFSLLIFYTEKVLIHTHTQHWNFIGNACLAEYILNPVVKNLSFLDTVIFYLNCWNNWWSVFCHFFIFKRSVFVDPAFALVKVSVSAEEFTEEVQVSNQFFLVILVLAEDSVDNAEVTDVTVTSLDKVVAFYVDFYNERTYLQLHLTDD